MIFVIMAAAEAGVSACKGVSTTTLKSKIICFVSSKEDVMAFDDILKICTDFYYHSDIMEAQSLLEKCGISMHKRRGPEKNRSTVEDITTVMLNPRTTIPTFYAIISADCPLLMLNIVTYLPRPLTQIAEHFEMNTVLWTFHTLQPSSWLVGV